MDVDRENNSDGGELRIKGRAEAEKRKSKWEDEGTDEVCIAILSG